MINWYLLENFAFKNLSILNEEKVAEKIKISKFFSDQNDRQSFLSLIIQSTINVSSFTPLYREISSFYLKFYLRLSLFEQSFYFKIPNLSSIFMELPRRKVSSRKKVQHSFFQTFSFMIKNWSEFILASSRFQMVSKLFYPQQVLFQILCL